MPRPRWPLKRRSPPDVLLPFVLVALVVAALAVQRTKGPEGGMLHLNAVDLDGAYAEEYAREYTSRPEGAAWCAAFLKATGDLRTLHLYSAVLFAPEATRRNGQQADPDDEARVVRIFEEACRG